MTISSEVNKSGPYEGDDANTSFAYGFKIYDQDDISVIYTDSVGAETVLTVDVDYTVNDVGSATGTIDYPISGDELTTGEYITIIRDMTLTQEVDFENQGGYYPEVVEAALDRLVMITQQLEEELDRAVRVEASSSTDPADLIASLTAASAAAVAAAAAAAASEASAAADLVATNQDTIDTAADAVATAADAVATAADAAATAADLVQTNLDQISCDADATATAADAIATAADAASTAADAIATAADAVSCDADATAAAASAAAAAASAATVPTFDTLTGEAGHYGRVKVGETDVEWRTEAETLADIGAEAADADILKADTTDELTVGFTNTSQVITTNNFTPDLTAQATKVRGVTGNVTINFPSGGNGMCVIMLKADASGPYTVTLGTNVNPVGTIPDLAASTDYICSIVRQSTTFATVQILEIG